MAFFVIRDHELIPVTPCFWGPSWTSASCNLPLCGHSCNSGREKVAPAKTITRILINLEESAIEGNLSLREANEPVVGGGLTEGAKCILATESLCQRFLSMGSRSLAYFKALCRAREASSQA